MKQPQKITICACSSRSIMSREKIAQLAAQAQKAGLEVILVSDLCELCETKDKSVHALAETTLVACYPRAVKSLMAYVGESVGESIDLRNGSVEEALQVLGIAAQQDDEASAEAQAPWTAQLEAMPQQLGEDAWYPTVDKDVCCECGKCLEFCPFGVYEMVEDRIRVVHPTHCKNNCPACARTCPASAIIFPKYDRSPINGGPAQEEKAVQLDTKTLYNEAFRERLAARKISLTKPSKK